MFGGEYSVIYNEAEVLTKTLVRGRAILAGRGGDGKTWLLRRLFNQVLEKGDIPLFVDLKQWSGADYDAWQEWTAGDVHDAADFIVRRFTGFGIGTIEFDLLPPRTRKVIFIDGLNEITSKVGSEVLTVVDHLVSSQIGVSVVVADRLIRRELPNPQRWYIGSPLPLTSDEIARHLKSATYIHPSDIRSSPFFLDAELKYGLGGSRRAVALETLIAKHSGLKNGEIECAASGAFDAYKQSRSRTFSRSRFAEVAGNKVLEQLERAGMVRSQPGSNSYFIHHIVHDYLVATYVSRLPEDEWTPSLLRTVSFDASSFDAVELAFETLPDGKADRFLQKLYDWNLYAAGYALAKATETDCAVSKEMRTVIFSMLAEKCFDPILATRQRARDALLLMQLPEATRFRNTSSLGEVCAVVAEVESNVEWFVRWRDVFLGAEHGELTEEFLSEVRSANSIIGWTVANVAKRLRSDERVVAMLVALAKNDQNPTVRWRVAHILGAQPTRQALETLLCLIDEDRDGDVRYGATRSLIELATISTDQLRRDVAEAVRQRAAVFSENDRVARELRASLLVAHDLAPQGWMVFVRDCVRALFSQSEKRADRDLWRGCLNTAEALYQPPSP
ncbi:MAG: HEAT repeat domain-containing protein [Rhodospirillales bacterium]|nr:HEAT repeat domain-containing protein [Rhodospirillales bacterium]